jgi:hypothetical protein
MVLGRLAGIYESVLIPFGENTRYDLVVEEAGRFLKVQCKTGRRREGSIRFRVCSFYYHHPDKRGKPFSSRPYTGEVDCFGVYCPDNDVVYLVPANEVADCRNMVTLRLVPPRNNQVKKIRWASDYEIKPG